MVGFPCLTWKIPSGLCCDVFYKQVKLFKPAQRMKTQRKNYFYILKSASRKSENWIIFLTDLFLMNFFTLDFPSLLSKHRSEATPAGPALPLKNSHWAFQEGITALMLFVGVCVCTAHTGSGQTKKQYWLDALFALNWFDSSSVMITSAVNRQHVSRQGWNWTMTFSGKMLRLMTWHLRHVLPRWWRRQ